MHALVALVPFIALVQADAPKIEARALASADAVAPGSAVELAVEISIEKDWHLYHPIFLDAGGPTKLKITAPAGVHFGPVRFPPPTAGELGGFAYLGYHDKLVLLTEMSLDASAAVGRSVDLSIVVEGFACHDELGCRPVELPAALSMPVRGEPGKPANEAFFKAARAAETRPFEQGTYIAGSAISLSKDKLTLDDDAEVVATIRVKPGFHINAPDPGVEGLIGSRLDLEALDGVEFGEAAWPKPKSRELEGVDQVREYAGEFQVRVPVRLSDKQFARGPVAVRVLFYYQACSDKGQCFPPEYVQGVIRFTADTPAPAGKDPTGHGTLLPSVTVGSPQATSAGPPAAGATVAANSASPPSLAWIIVIGFMGGLILNIMPCVLPVISIKVLGFVQQANEDPRRVLRLGLAFAAGVLAWFWAYAVFLWLRNEELPLQHPVVVVALSAIVFVFALNLFGVFEIVLPGAATGKLDALSSGEGYVGAFSKGLLATLLGTACTAPFFVTATAYAATQPPYIRLAIFTAAGLGMASPYVLLAANTRWLRFVPRPGPWMITFKQATGFVLLATVVWLLQTVAAQLGAGGVIWTVAFLGFLGLAAWMYGLAKHHWPRAARLRVQGGALTAAALGGWFCFGVMYEPEKARVAADVAPEQVVERVAQADWAEGIPWQPYRPGLAEELARRGYTVYVDYTAEWCPTCKVNKKFSLEIDSTRGLMRELGVIPIVADYTKQDPQMKADLVAFGQTNVPLNLIYPANATSRDGVIRMDTVLTPGAVQTALKRAGASTGGRSVARGD